MTQIQYRKLSEVIESVGEGERLGYLKLFLAAVEAETIDAVPNEATFNIKKKIQRDLMFDATPAFEEWHAVTVRALTLRRKGRGLAVHSDDVVAGKVDFKAKAKAFRQELKRRKGRVKPKAGPAKLKTETQQEAQPVSAAHSQKAGQLRTETE